MSGLSVELRQIRWTPKMLRATKVRSSGSQTVEKDFDVGGGALGGLV